MPPYGSRIPHLDRWAVVTYVRQLQGRGGASAAPAPPQASPGGAALDAGTVPAGGEPQPAAGTPPTTLENRPSSTVP
jgi:hypothetical protein